MAEFRRLSMGTGGGGSYEPPEVDGEEDEDSNLPIDFQAHCHKFVTHHNQSSTQSMPK